MRIKKIVSGGQTGADQGGLNAAITLGISHGGWCPKGRLAENGTIPEKYQLTETSSSSYLRRTELNVKESDATLVFCYGQPLGGTKRTIEFAIRHSKPVLVVDFRHSLEENLYRVERWFSSLCVEDIILNIAGSRASKTPHLQRSVEAFLNTCLQKNTNG